MQSEQGKYAPKEPGQNYISDKFSHQPSSSIKKEHEGTKDRQIWTLLPSYIILIIIEINQKV